MLDNEEATAVNSKGVTSGQWEETYMSAMGVLQQAGETESSQFDRFMDYCIGIFGADVHIKDAAKLILRSPNDHPEEEVARAFLYISGDPENPSDNFLKRYEEFAPGFQKHQGQSQKQSNPITKDYSFS
jgi:hypothetical protein